MTVSLSVKLFFADGIVVDTPLANADTLKNSAFLTVYTRQ